jgi:hypothetical protein
MKRGRSVKIKSIALFLFSLIPLVALSAPPDTGFFVDLSHPEHKFEYTTFVGNTPSIPVQILTNGAAYTNFTGYTPELNYFLNDAASAGKTISGTLSGSIATFQALTNSFPAKGDYFAEVYMSLGSLKITCGQGVLHVQRSPSSGSYGPLNLSPRINWDLVTNVGTPPWTALTEPVFLASIAYQITAGMTGQWTTAYAHSQADTVTSNSGNWMGTIWGLTSNDFTSTNSIATITADVTVLKGKTSSWNTAKTDSSTATNWIGTNTLQTQITANSTNQAATNLYFRGLHDNQASTNAQLLAAINAGSGASNTANIVIVSNAFVAADFGLSSNILAVSNTFVSADTAIRNSITTLSNKVVADDNALSTTILNTSNGYVAADSELSGNIIAASNMIASGDATVSNAFVAADSVLNAKINTASNYFADVDYAQSQSNGVLQSAISVNAAGVVSNTAKIFALSNAYIAANAVISNDFKAGDLVVSNAFVAADLVVSNAFVAADLIISNAYLAAISSASNNLVSQMVVVSNGLYTQIVAVVTNQSSTNVLLQSQITSNRTEQMASNDIFKARMDAIESTNYTALTSDVFTNLYVANRSCLDSNIAGLTSSTYTGSLTSVAFTGVTVLAESKLYAWGFYKINAFGTATLSIASASLTAIAAGYATNQFSYSGSDTNLILTLSGDGASLTFVSNVYVRLVTNGNAAVAGDVSVGGVIRAYGGILTNPAAHIAATSGVHGLGNIAWSNSVDFVATNNSTYTNTVGKASAAYPSNNPSGFTNATVTNGINAVLTNALELQAASNLHFETTKVGTNDAAYTNALVLSAAALPAASTNGWEIGSHASLLITNGSGAGLTGITAAQVGAVATNYFAGYTNWLNSQWFFLTNSSGGYNAPD